MPVSRPCENASSTFPLTQPLRRRSRQLSRMHSRRISIPVTASPRVVYQGRACGGGKDRKATTPSLSTARGRIPFHLFARTRSTWSRAPAKLLIDLPGCVRFHLCLRRFCGLEKFPERAHVRPRCRLAGMVEQVGPTPTDQRSLRKRRPRTIGQRPSGSGDPAVSTGHGEHRRVWGSKAAMLVSEVVFIRCLVTRP